VALMIHWWFACTGEVVPPRPDAPLVDVASWETASSADPFEDERPDGASCDDGAAVEGGTFEIDTGRCTWAWFEQPSLAEVRSGDTLEFVFWHGYLDAPAPAQTHVAVVLGDEVLHEVFLDVPGEPDAHTEVFTAPDDAPEGTPVGLHLHNHGSNTYNVLRLDRLGD
jgi:hypothetical protein